MEGSFLKIAGTSVSCMKISEDNTGTVLRVYNVSAETEIATLEFNSKINAAVLTDSNERPMESIAINGNQITFPVPAYSVITVKVQ